MRKTSLATAIVAAVTALVLLWPTLTANIEEPLAGNWYPYSDPGLVLTRETADRKLELLAGKRMHGVRELVAAEPFKAEIRSYSRTSDENARVTGQTSVTIEGWAALGGGFGDNQRFEFDLQSEDAFHFQCVLIGPVVVASAPLEKPLLVAEIADLRFRIEWHQTADHATLRLVPTADRRPDSLGGDLRFDDTEQDQAIAFQLIDGHLDASVPMQMLDGWAGIETNTNITVTTNPDSGGVRVQARIKRP